MFTGMAFPGPRTSLHLAGVAASVRPESRTEGRVDTLVTRAVFFPVQHYFTVNFSHENQKALELRTEDAKDCDEWVAAIAHARYVLPTPPSPPKRRNTRALPGANRGPEGEGGDGREGERRRVVRRALGRGPLGSQSSGSVPPSVPPGAGRPEEQPPASFSAPAPSSPVGELSPLWLGSRILWLPKPKPGLQASCSHGSAA